MSWNMCYKEFIYWYYLYNGYLYLIFIVKIITAKYEFFTPLTIYEGLPNKKYGRIIILSIYNGTYCAINNMHPPYSIWYNNIRAKIFRFNTSIGFRL